MVLEERIDFLTKFHDMFRRFLQEKDILKKETLTKNLTLKPQISKQELKGFRKRISKNFSIDKRKSVFQAGAGENSSLLSNYLRKQRLQEYQSNTKYYQENPFKSNKKQQENQNILPTALLKNLEKISEIEEHNEKK